MSDNQSNQKDLFQAFASMSPEEQRRAFMALAANVGIKVQKSQEFGPIVSQARDAVFGALTLTSRDLPAEAYYTLLSEGSGDARGTATVLDEEIPGVKGIRRRVQVYRTFEVEKVTVTKDGKPTITNKSKYHVTETAATLKSKDRLPQFEPRKETPEDMESVEEGSETVTT